MLGSWTQIDFETLVGPNINSPKNAIYMTKTKYVAFGRFKFYLDKEAVSRFRGDLSLLSWRLIPFSTRIFPTSTKYGCPELANV
jgi:hypothetical protein